MRMKLTKDVHYSMLAIWCFALHIAFTLLQDVGTDTNFDIHISSSQLQVMSGSQSEIQHTRTTVS